MCIVPIIDTLITRYVSTVHLLRKKDNIKACEREKDADEDRLGKMRKEVLQQAYVIPCFRFYGGSHISNRLFLRWRVMI